MNLFHLLPSTYIGGAELFAKNLHLSLRNDYKINSNLLTSVIIPDLDTIPFSKFIDLDFFTSDSKFIKSINTIIGACLPMVSKFLLPKLRSYLTEVDVLHIHLPSTSYRYTFILSLLISLGYKCVVTIHFCQGNERPFLSLRRAINQALLKSNIKIVAVGCHQKKRIADSLRINQEYIDVIENAAFMSQNSYKCLEDFDIAYNFISVGVFQERKNQIQIIHLFSEIFDKLSGPANLVFYGDHDNEYGRRCKDLVEDLNLSHLIRFWGWTNGSDVIYASSSFIITTSSHEGRSLAIDEAIKRGLILIATPESIESFSLNRDSDYISIGNSGTPPLNLVAKLNDLSFLQTLRRASLKKAWSRSWRNVCRDYTDLYSELSNV
jgi:glycosyltransferase involved in cell wall biosynthesis